jgi:hypothetical protein
VVSVTDPYCRVLGFLGRSRCFFFSKQLSCTREAEWTSFQTHYFSENLVAPGIEPGPAVGTTDVYYTELIQSQIICVTT